MSIILTGPGNRVMLAAPGRPAFAGPLIGGSISSPAGLAAIPGLTGWWDAGQLTGIVSPAMVPLTAFGAAAGGVLDKSGTGAPLTAWHQGASGALPPVALSHLNGLLGGIGRSMVVPPALPVGGQQLPVMDPDQGLIGPPANFGSNAAWTVFLVWSRPNWRQTGAGDSVLLSIGGTAVLSVTNSGVADQLLLFPGLAGTVLSSTIARRHTHAVTIRNTPGIGLDVWVDATLAATAVTNPSGASFGAAPLFLHAGTVMGGAECWFHEAALWNTAVAAADVAIIHSWQRRWTLGPRKGIQIVVTGQSNAGNGLNDGAWHLLAQGVAWHLGALAYGVVGAYGAPPAATCIHGEGLYPVPALGLSGSFLNNPGDGSSPATWALGTDGLAVQTWLAQHTAAADMPDVAAIFWPWSEDDSTRQYSEKASYDAAARRFLALQRAMLSRSAGGLPQLWWSAIPFAYNNNDSGTQMQREAVADLVSDPAQNVTVVLPQTSDSIPRGAAYDATYGTWTGGDPLHRDVADNRRFGMLAAPLAARAILAAGGGDTITSIPSGIPSAGGPTVSHVYRQSNTVLIVTVRHDGGNDLIVPVTQAATGAGWAVMDGGTVAAPGPIVRATACARLNAAQLQITLAAALVSSSTNCRLFYPFGTDTIGRGNAVTDNLASIAAPPGWNITADLGSAWSLNMPVHIPMSSSSGIALSDTPT